MKHVPILLIGGVGRSGTNVLKYVMDTHSKVYSLPFEARFTIDPDGIVPTYALLKEAWSPFVSEIALERLSDFLNRLSQKNIQDKMAIGFSNLFKQFGLDGNIRAYKEWELETILPNFEVHNTKLINDIKLLDYEGTWAGSKGSLTKKASNTVGLSNNNNALDVIFNEYLYNLYNDLLISKNKSFYVEDNTFNILYAHYYSRLLPGVFMVHMVRDPRDVVASYIKQRWCPKDIKRAVKYYVELIERWFEVKKFLNNDFYMEIKLEDLCTNTEKVLNNLCAKLPIDYESSMLHYDLSKSNSGRWKNEFSENEQNFLNEQLAHYIQYYGYGDILKN
jgi:hypothetical protein